MTTAKVLAIKVVTAIIKTIAMIPTIVTTIVPGTVTTSGAFAATTIVLGRRLEGRSLFLPFLLLLLNLLESSSTDVGRVIDQEGRDQLSCVLSDFFVRLGVFFLRSMSTSQERSLVELHGRGDR